LRKLFLLFFIPVISCQQPEKKFRSADADTVVKKEIPVSRFKFQYNWLEPLAYNSASTLFSRFKIPDKFICERKDSESMTEWLLGLPLFPDGAQVHLYTGELKGYQGAHAAVINIDVSDQDLQQGIYAVIRLRAEYLFATKQFDKIVFASVDSLHLDYLQYLKGKRIIIQGNKTSVNYYGKKYADPADHHVFLLFMDDVFRYAEASAIYNEMKTVAPDSIEPGDVFIHVGNAGHAVMVVSVAKNPGTGEKIFMLAQSYRPAQQMHVLKNDFNKNISPWYVLHSKSKLITPEYVFDWGELKRF
jgi:hypothetical protein